MSDEKKVEKKPEVVKVKWSPLQTTETAGKARGGLSLVNPKKGSGNCADYKVKR